MNTKFDYEYTKKHNSPGWQQHWQNLLDGRFIVENNELIEDQNAPIFRLGFTVAEVAEAIQHVGYTGRQLDWYQSQPDRYSLIAGAYVQLPGWAEAKAVADLAAARLERMAENRNDCSAHILARYPLPMQSSAAMGIYPAAVKEAMVDFIGRCIAEENRVFDLLETTATMAALAAIEKPQYPEV